MKPQKLQIIPVQIHRFIFIIRDPDSGLYYQGHYWSTSKFGARGFRLKKDAEKKAVELENDMRVIIDAASHPLTSKAG